jgi:hypothetical protein
MVNDDRQLIPASAARRSAERGGYLVIGAVAVIALVAAYAVIGAPGLHTQVAKAPVEAVPSR